MIRKIEESVKDLIPWISSEEMALIGLDAGYENTFRDRLLLPLQNRFSKSIVRSEYYTNNKRADIAILDDRKKIKCIVELKHNYTFQLNLLTGKKGIDWKKGQSPQNKSGTRIENEFARWKASKFQLFCINLVTHFEFIDESYKSFLKYKKLSHKDNKLFYKYYSKYLAEYQKVTPLISTEYNLQLHKPYSASGKLIISIFQNETRP